ncbi:MAG: hypothetical protein IJ430_08455 [Parabacteroides sp.]|nr:hypothetical protein [Parabacteroides sp.]
MNSIDSLTQVVDTLTNTVNTTAKVSQTESYQWVYWLGGAIAIALVSYGIVRRRSSKYFQLKQKMKSEPVDFNGVINNAFYSQELYDMLKKKCHPDRFSTNPILEEKATKIFALIVENKYNYKALSLLKSRAEKELNITF